MICDKMQIAACRAMIGYCDGAGGQAATVPSSAAPRSGAIAPHHHHCPHHYWPVIPAPIDAIEEDPDNRPYIWDLE